jgi:hypothetical protein
MIAIVFAGPSLPPSSTPPVPGLEWRSPVRQGDLYKAVRSRPALIGLVDGYFEVVATVWHKEILWAMSEGIHVYGAASIGALRAAELADFGMKGVGHIYEEFRSRALVDDAEVALLHGPAEVDYVQVTEAMVNVRATINRAVQLGVVEPMLAAQLLGVAASLFYKERTYDVILHKAAELGLSQASLHRLATWLPGGQIDQKRLDALRMVQAITDHLSRGVSPLEVSYQFAHTFGWEEARQRAEADLSACAKDHF